MGAARDRVVAARGRLLIYHPFFGMVVTKLKLIETEEIATFATNGESLLFNPNFADKLQDNQLETVLAHEAMHVVLAHPLRFHTPIEPSARVKELHLEKFNMAADYAINPILVDANFKGTDGWLMDPKFKGMATEEIYKKLPEPKTVTVACGCGEGFQGDQKGKGQGQNGPQGPRPCGGILPHPSTGKSEAEKTEAQVNHRILVSESYQFAKARGLVPGAITELVNEMLNPQVDWKAKLRHLIELVTRNDFSWSRPNRRYLQGGICLPSLWDKTLGKIALVIDTSGSIDHKALAEFTSELNGVLDLAKPEEVLVIHCDAAVAKVERFTPDDYPIVIVAEGRGGTDFKPPFKWMQDNDETPLCILYLTDMFCDSFPEDPGVPVMWVIEPRGDKNRVPPFGERIFLEDVA